MKALQLHYTSCRRGRSGSAGFQTRTMTSGIRPNEQREIERRGGFRPPRDANQEPNQEQIAREFPVALRYYPLETGRWALTCSRYTGRDYSGRWGNFFAHTLVLPDILDASFWPIDTFEWPHWHTGLTPEEDTEADPPELPEIELGEMVTESFRLTDLRDFLCEEEGRARRLALMARALISGLGNSRSLVLRDSSLNNLYWIACLQKLFPPRYVARLSFSTYQEDPRGSADINATCGETGFSFSETERYYQFYMFDLVGGVASEVPDHEDDFAALAARLLAEKPSELERFYTFMDFFDHQRVDEELTAAFHLFELSQQRDAVPEGERLASMIQFAARYATAEGREQLLKVVARALADLGGLKNPEDYEGVVRFLADGARATRRAEDRQLAFETWLCLVDDFVFRSADDRSTADRAIATASITWQHLRSTLSEYEQELAKWVMSPSRWQGFREPSDKALQFQLQLGWRCLGLLPRQPAYEQQEINDLVTELLRRENSVDRALMILEAIPTAANAIAGMSRLVSASLPGDDDPRQRGVLAGRALSRLLAARPPTLGQDVRRRLAETNDWYLLYGEWLELLESAADPMAAFKEYRQAVLNILPGYGEAALPWAAGSLLDLLEDKKQKSAAAQATQWLLAGDIGAFPEELCRRCLELANETLSLDQYLPSDDEIAQHLTEAAETRRITLQPNRPHLRQAMIEISHGVNCNFNGLQEMGRALPGVSAGEYRSFLDTFLPLALPQATTRKDHSQLVDATFKPSHSKIFNESYLRCIGQQPKKARFSALLATLKFWLGVDKRTQKGKTLAPLEEPAIKELVRVLSMLSPKDYKKIENNLANLRSGNEELRWRQIKKRVEEYEEGAIKKIRRLLPRLTGLLNRR